jgi:metallo-beta-lactamase family protein
MTTASPRQVTKRLFDPNGARVIISASGMMTGGRVLHHGLRLVGNPEATIVFVGYQAAGTTGRRILDGEPEVKILGQWIPVRCRVAKIGGFSAHADWSEVLRWLEGMESGVPQQTFLTHGEPEAANAMAGHIKEKFGWKVHVPQYGERIDLV